MYKEKMPKIDLSSLKKYAVVAVLLFLMALFTIANPSFLTIRNLTNIIIQNTYILIVGVGISFVMLGGGIDLSVGYQMSLVGVVTSICITIYHLPVWPSIAIGLLLGICLGFFNGMIVAYIKVFPLLATIATSALFQGVSFLISQSNSYRRYPDEFLILTRAKVLGIPLDILIALLAILIAVFVYKETVFGFRVYAVGGNEEAARLAGINTRRTKVILYSLCGFCAAAGTMLMMSRANFHSSSFGPGTDITCLTAAIIGGISFVGGEGSVLGLVAGVFILAVVGNGMQLAGWGAYAQFVVKGFILIGAVLFDEYQKVARKKPSAKPSRPAIAAE